MISTRRLSTALPTLVLALVAGMAWAQHGPRIPPCEGCPVSETERPYPRTGMWFDPQRSGSGINLEVQNGFAFGLFFTFTEAGDPIWYEFSGRLQPVEDGEGYWKLSSELVRFRGGNCIDCPYRPSEIEGSRGRFDLKVIQRNLISYTLDGGETYRMLPLVWGTPMSVEFPEVADHGQPMFPRDEQVSPWGFEDGGTVPWVLVLRTPNPGTGLYLQSSAVFWVMAGSASNRREFVMIFFQIFANSPELAIPINLTCGSVDDPNVHGGVPADVRERLGSEPLCILRRQVGTGLFNYYMAPLGDVGDDYFIATAEDGSVIEGHRLLYR